MTVHTLTVQPGDEIRLRVVEPEPALALPEWAQAEELLHLIARLMEADFELLPPEGRGGTPSAKQYLRARHTPSGQVLGYLWRRKFDFSASLDGRWEPFSWATAHIEIAPPGNRRVPLDLSGREFVHSAAQYFAHHA